jgi:hypothetical protein
MAYTNHPSTLQKLVRDRQRQLERSAAQTRLRRDLHRQRRRLR